ncbi:MAG: metal-dependent transcriptional regulator [Bellilinea sp.]
MLTSSVENYLKTIYSLQQETGWASTSAIAEIMEVANPSVTMMLKRMAAMDPALITYVPYEGAKLTPGGERQALDVIRVHRLMETFLVKALGYTWDEVHEDAERLEHASSPRLIERMASFLGDPARDPHGEDIPDRNGKLPQRSETPLTQLDPGQSGRIVRVAADKPDILRYLDEIGLTLDVTVEVLEKAPFSGPVTIKNPQPGSAARALGREVTNRIYVEASD